MKKLYYLFGLAFVAIILQSGVTNSAQPPTDATGATGSFCNDCHSGSPLNSAGGSVVLNGLPTSYVPNQQYNLSLTITHSAANRQRWGFSMIAVNGMGNPVGTFSTTNANAALNGNELSHNNAVSTSPTSTFTYNNLRWTAPSTGANGAIRFYYVGNAANGGGSNGDFIYAANTLVALPISLKLFTAQNIEGMVKLSWQTDNEINSNFFEVERSDDGQFFFALDKINAAGNSTATQEYSYIDKKITNASTIFYRLRMVDKDGTEKYSKTISINSNFTQVTIKNVYPSIIKIGEEFTTEIVSDKNRILSVSVLSYSGKVLETKNYQLNKGANIIKTRAQASGFKGLMFIKYESADFRQTKTILAS